MNKDVIYLRIDEEIKKKLDMFALEDNRSLNNLVATILIKYVEKRERESKNE